MGSRSPERGFSSKLFGAFLNLGIFQIGFSYLLPPLLFCGKTLLIVYLGNSYLRPLARRCFAAPRSLSYILFRIGFQKSGMVGLLCAMQFSLTSFLSPLSSTNSHSHFRWCWVNSSNTTCMIAAAPVMQHTIVLTIIQPKNVIARDKWAGSNKTYY